MASRAFMGDVEMLSRYGLQLDETKIKRLQSMKVIGQVAEKQRDELIRLEKLNQSMAYFARFQGQAAAEAVTTAGSIAKLTNAWGDYKEELGKVVTTSGAFASATRQLTGYLQQLKANLESGISAGWISTLNGWVSNIATMIHESRVELEKFNRMGELSKAGTMESSTHYEAWLGKAMQERRANRLPGSQWLGGSGRYISPLGRIIAGDIPLGQQSTDELLALGRSGVRLSGPFDWAEKAQAIGELRNFGGVSEGRRTQLEGMFGTSLKTPAEAGALVSRIDELIKEIRAERAGTKTQAPAVNVTVNNAGALTREEAKRIAEVAGKRLADELDAYAAQQNPLLGAVGGGR